MSLDDREFCAECFRPIVDAHTPGCGACKKRAQYRRRKETQPELLRLLNRAKHVRCDMARGRPWATDELLEQRLREYRQAREAA